MVMLVVWRLTRKWWHIGRHSFNELHQTHKVDASFSFTKIRTRIAQRNDLTFGRTSRQMKQQEYVYVFFHTQTSVVFNVKSDRNRRILAATNKCAKKTDSSRLKCNVWIKNSQNLSIDLKTKMKWNEKWIFVIVVVHLCVDNAICLIDPITIGTVVAVGMQIMTSFPSITGGNIKRKKNICNCLFLIVNTFLFSLNRWNRLLVFRWRWQHKNQGNVQQIFRNV